ncbi:ATP-binding protein [Vibrio ponticus]|uniref:ATP-binding protein n=1 Tax=Vibrio ponticus TaxID=265668 RepID=A0A3N3DU47_9VIBR|nr:AAA family ATPase [Vibrio ponticus]ROV57906.1 ATP-binding protein [Vibrio ponticus]
MRLKSIYISEYKNLKDFSLNFSQEHFLEVFVGKNGSGKSNFIEALLEVLRHIYQYDWTNNRHDLLFSYKLDYEINGQEIQIEFDFATEKLKINGNERATVGATPKPDNILTYYAGHNTAVNELLTAFEEKFSRRIIRADHDESRPFIGISSTYNDLLLAVIALLPDASSAKQYVTEKLGIEEIVTDFKVNLKRPLYAQKTTSAQYDVQVGDDSTKYWKLAGTSLASLEAFERCFSDPDPIGRVRTEGYLPDSDTYQYYYSFSKVREHFPEYSSHDFFRVFDNLKTLGMLESITLTLKTSDGQEIMSNMFSDGQFQAIYLFAISEIFKESNCITVMDEPDSFLHPEWQAECSEQVQALSREAAASNHVIMTTHSAVTLINSPHTKVKYFDLKDGKANVYALPKRIAVDRLCSNVIRYAEEEQLLSILNAIEIENKPVLFTEGNTDPIIIKEAWYKLYGEAEMPFIPFYAFSCTYIKQLITDLRIQAEMRGKPVFSLFDFDKAFLSWDGLKGEVVHGTVDTGLIKKWESGESYALLLPVPNIPQIRSQVISDEETKAHYGGDSLCEIEHLLYGELTSDYFIESPCKGGGRIIEFISDDKKVEFAKDVVPTLPSDKFEAFRPILDWITDKCVA